jgi:hypothetical protein
VRYLDSGTRRQADVLASWLLDVLDDEASEIRWQTGFFSIDAVGILIPTLTRLESTAGVVRCVLGSNLAVTLHSDVVRLLELIGLPRTNAGLGVVKYGKGLYHPKTFHIRRADGSQCAYVGSANYTYPGVSGINIEAGVVLDTRENDPEHVMDAVANAVDSWFVEDRPGFHFVDDTSKADELLAAGILSALLPSRANRPVEADDGDGEPLSTNDRQSPSLQPLVVLPRVERRMAGVRGETRSRRTDGSDRQTLAPAVQAQAATQPSAVREDFPREFLFDPSAISPTQSAAALTGVLLPGDAAGLVIRLNQDSARRFLGKDGTANLSIPISTLNTLRFGLFYGQYTRPRAEFDLHVRYLSDVAPIWGDSDKTNVMAYGYAEGESGHRDVRMLLPAGSIRTLAARIEAAGQTLPSVGDLAFLEWPLLDAPRFRITYLKPDSVLAHTAEQLMDDAEARGQLVGGDATWLPPGISPP